MNKRLFVFVLICAALFQTSLAVIVDPPLDVGIFGAGTAGIYAGRELETGGLNYKIFEFSKRTDGRMHTIEVDGVHYELGCMWLQEYDRNTVVEDAEEFDIDTKKFDQTSVSVFVNGVLMTPEEVAAGLAEYNRIHALAAPYRASGVSDAVAYRLTGYLGDNPFVELCFAFFHEQYIGDNLEYHSSLEWDYYQSSKPDRTVPDGYNTILHAVINEGPSIASKIQYHSRVVAVDASDPQGGAIVTYKQRVPQPSDNDDSSLLSDEDSDDGCNEDTDDETKWVTHKVYCKDVICTVPLAVLKSNGITFNPPMPDDMQHAVDHLLAGAVGKMILFFDNDAGRTALKKVNTNYIMRTSSVVNPRVNDCLMVFLNGWKIYHAPALISYYQGDCARAYETTSDEDLKDAHMVAYREIFGGPTLNTYLPDPTSWKRTHWVSRKNQGGAYTTLGLGSTFDDFDAFLTPFGAAGNIYIAGEHADPTSYGYVHGARNSGFYTGQRVVQKQMAR